MSLAEERFVLTRNQLRELWNNAELYAKDEYQLDLGETVHFMKLPQCKLVGYRDGDGPVFQIRPGQSTEGFKKVFELVEDQL